MLTNTPTASPQAPRDVPTFTSYASGAVLVTFGSSISEEALTRTLECVGRAASISCSALILDLSRLSVLPSEAIAPLLRARLKGLLPTGGQDSAAPSPAGALILGAVAREKLAQLRLLSYMAEDSGTGSSQVFKWAVIDSQSNLALGDLLEKQSRELATCYATLCQSQEPSVFDDLSPLPPQAPLHFERRDSTDAVEIRLLTPPRSDDARETLVTLIKHLPDDRRCVVDVTEADDEGCSIAAVILMACKARRAGSLTPVAVRAGPQAADMLERAIVGMRSCPNARGGTRVAMGFMLE